MVWDGKVSGVGGKGAKRGASEVQMSKGQEQGEGRPRPVHSGDGS